MLSEIKALEMTVGWGPIELCDLFHFYLHMFLDVCWIFLPLLSAVTLVDYPEVQGLSYGFPIKVAPVNAFYISNGSVMLNESFVGKTRTALNNYCSR